MNQISESLDHILRRHPEGLEHSTNHFKKVVSELWSDFSLCAFEKLLLTDNDDLSSDGIYILSEVGDRGYEATDLALRHVEHPRWTTRFELAGHLLSCNRHLTPEQINRSLRLVSDERVNVRCKMMEVLFRVGADKIKLAIDLFDQPDSLDSHIVGLKILQAEIYSAPDFKQTLLRNDPILAVYAGARFLTGSRDHTIRELLASSSSRFEVKYLSRRQKYISREYDT